MKRLLTIVILGICGLCLAAFAISCSSGPTNTGANTAGTMTPTPATSSTPCNAPTLALRKTAVELAISNGLNTYPPLKGRSLFDVQIITDPNDSAKGFLRVRIEGQAPGKAQMTNLTQLISPMMNPKCVMSVIFVPLGTIPGPTPTPTPGPTPSPAAGLVVPDYEWTACEPPKNLCPNGECGNCPRGSIPAGTPGQNSNSSSNSNSGSNGNSIAP